MTGEASDYQRGEMDISEQVATFRDAMMVTKWACLAIAVGVLFSTLLFCTASGFIGSLIPAVIVAAVGIFGLRSRAPGH